MEEWRIIKDDEGTIVLLCDDREIVTTWSHLPAIVHPFELISRLLNARGTEGCG